MIETAAVFDMCGNIIHFHVPINKSSGYIEDSRNLWDILWENREILGGVAHTHPWHGEPWFSHTDVTTFAACEAGLGKRLFWPIVTLNKVVTFRWIGPNRFDYGPVPFLKSDDICELRRLSEKGE